MRIYAKKVNRDEIRVAPLSFREFMSAFQGSREKALEEYMLYSGLPKVATHIPDSEA